MLQKIAKRGRSVLAFSVANNSTLSFVCLCKGGGSSQEQQVLAEACKLVCNFR